MARDTPTACRRAVPTESVKAFQREDLLHFWQKQYAPENAALIVTGNIKLAMLKPLLEKQFGGWKAGKAGTADVGTAETTGARLILVDRPGAQQTTVLGFLLGPGRSTPDYVPLEVMNTGLGGLFSSRLNLNLREAHGYTYGAGSLFNYHKDSGPFFAYAPVRTDATARRRPRCSMNCGGCGRRR